jgi:tetratricopeptide (TPR) repeat protein
MVNAADLAEDLSMAEDNRCPRCGALLSSNALPGFCALCLMRQALVDETSHLADIEATTDPGTSSVEGGPEPPQASSGATGADAPGPGADLGTIDVTTAPTDTRATALYPGASPGLARGATVRYFGDYELQAELGRGGMGVVYRARQLSLNRPVALKMIKAGVLADEADLRRFQNEAEAVALLDHRWIVAVYEVGEHEGQKYFSMKLVEGGNLAEQLGTFRTNPKATAAVMAEAAEAVQHAHVRGILHRDLKPANILIDAEGHPHVTDFGLAKRVERDAELTQSGAILGTPAYMSPEQTTARRGSITTATDVYGLGAILYALLTGKAPFGGNSVIETLDAVRTCAPEPPRKLNAQVPDDLETICLKCLEKDPRRRYASAHELAADLRNWLESRPIAARRVGTLERAWLWCKRKPAVAALSAGTVVALVTGTATTIAVQAKANSNLSRQYEATKKAETLAEQRLDRAMEAVRDYYTGFAEDALTRQQIPKELRERLLAKPAQFYGELTKELTSKANPTRREQVMLAAGRLGLGRLLKTLGRPSESRRECEAAVDQLKRLYAKESQDPKLTRALADSYNALATALHGSGEIQRASEAYSQAIALLESISPESDKDEVACEALSQSYNSQGVVLRRLGESTLARKACEHAVALRAALATAHPEDMRHQSLLADYFTSLGAAIYAGGEAVPAKAAYQQAIDRYEALVKLHPTESRYRAGLALAYNNISGPLSALGEAEADLRVLEKAIKLREALVAELPGVPQYRDNLGICYYNLATRLRDDGSLDRAREIYAKSTAQYELLINSNPDVPEYRAGLGDSYSALGRCLETRRLGEEARKACEKAIAEYEKVSGARPGEADFQERLAGGYATLAGILNDIGERDRARELLEIALPKLEALLRANPNTLEYRASIADAYLNLGTNLLGPVIGGTGDPRRAIEVIETARAHYEAMCRARPGLDVDRLGLARSYAKLGIARKYAGEMDQAQAAYEKAIAGFLALAAANPTATVYRGDLERNSMNLGLLHLARVRFDDAERAFRNSLQYAESGSASAKQIQGMIGGAQTGRRIGGRFAGMVRGTEAPRDAAERVAVAEMCYDRGFYGAAVRFWGEAIDADPALAANRDNQIRYSAACAAALAAGGRGKDNRASTAASNAKLRKQAKQWLTADLGDWSRLFEGANAPQRAAIARTLRHWRQGSDLECLRDEKELAHVWGGEL